MQSSAAPTFVLAQDSSCWLKIDWRYAIGTLRQSTAVNEEGPLKSGPSTLKKNTGRSERIRTSGPCVPNPFQSVLPTGTP